ncbi:MAG: Swt1 family HEPN domain-containing protein [Ignavibacteriales bacterium]|nr:Swt1 family HEPN domain-containing protein [Ignavibacteriales bacterium]
MVNKSLRRELLSRLKVTQQALSFRAKKIKDKFGPMTTEEAVYVIAHKEGLDLSRYLKLDQLDRVRALVPKDMPAPRQVSPKRQPGSVKAKYAFPLVPLSTISRAMAIGQETYPQVVVLETSIRTLIESILKKINVNWWPDLIDPDVVKSVNRIKKKEANYPYRERRGKKDILYCNFADLKTIIDYQYPHFKFIIVDQAWFDAKMNEIYMARNNLAHSVLLSKDDISRIALFYRDWSRLLKTAGLS